MARKQKPKSKSKSKPHSARELLNTDYFVVPHPRIDLFKKSALYSISVAWNSLYEIRSSNAN
jgi:hypothetical protein